MNLLLIATPDMHWKRCADYIRERCHDTYDVYAIPFIPVGHMSYYSKKLQWNLHFFMILGAVKSQWYRSDSWRHHNSLNRDDEVFASQEAGVIDFAGWLQRFSELEDEDFYKDAVREYGEFMKYAQEQEQFETPVETIHPKPTPNPTAPEPDGAKKDWKKPIHSIATVVLAVWFLVDWFVPIPEIVKAGIKSLLDALVNL